MAAGPLTKDQFEQVVEHANSVEIHGLKGKALYAGEVLRKCNFELVVEHEDVRGDVYIANRSNKLFVAVPVDSLMSEGSFAFASSQETGGTFETAENTS